MYGSITQSKQSVTEHFLLLSISSSLYFRRKFFSSGKFVILRTFLIIHKFLLHYIHAELAHFLREKVLCLEHYICFHAVVLRGTLRGFACIKTLLFLRLEHSVSIAYEEIFSLHLFLIIIFAICVTPFRKLNTFGCTSQYG